MRPGSDFVEHGFFGNFFDGGASAAGTAIAAGATGAGTTEGAGIVLFDDGLLGLHGFDVLEGEMFGLEDDAAEDVFGELDVAFNAGDFGAFALEEGEDVDATLLAFDFVGESAFIPLAQVEDFGIGTMEDVFDFLFCGLPGAGGVGGIQKEQGFVLTCMGGHRWRLRYVGVWGRAAQQRYHGIRHLPKGKGG